MPPRKKPLGLDKLKMLLPKNKPSILSFPDDPENNVHWIFGILVILVITFILSAALVGNSGVEQYLSLLG